MATRHFSNRKEILDHLSKHRKSGLTRSAYCKKHSIAESTFYYWHRFDHRLQFQRDDAAARSVRTKQRGSSILGA